ncbi:putative F-box/kelch-repeat protein At1g15680 [Papaver somniferum]|uniref:putative F-box/kelch-repeat protein At1g15680 n=1 Tax=Papaver somniferum TaxID=3469 RepID=UPI000E704865|nr:putative F-box/kelch-repeat protein At1g15680 [Papaver somniferum]
MKKIKILGRLLLRLAHRKIQNKRGKSKPLNSQNVAEDIWFEIFLHLPFESVFKFRCVSKVWFSVLSNPNFMKKWYKLNNLSLPWALVHHAEDRSKQNNKLRRMFTIAYPDSYSKFISPHRNGLSFSFLTPSNDNEILDLYLLGSSNGLVLCTVNLTRCTHIQTYYVCNPLMKKWVLLPPPPEKSRWVVHGFICNDECMSESLVPTNYKVVRIPGFRSGKANKFVVEIFSSDVGEWNAYEVSCPEDVTWGFTYYSDLVIHNSVMYLVEKQDRVVAYNLNQNTSGEAQCTLIKLPGVESAQNELNLDPNDYYSRHCLGLSEGMICYGAINRMDMTLSVWVLEEEWRLTHKDTIFQNISGDLLFGIAFDSRSVRDNFIRNIQVIGFNPVDKNMVMLGCGNFIWSYNIRTRGYKNLYNPSFLSTARSPNLPHQRISLAFVFNPRPTVLPPASWVDTSIDTGCINISNRE